MDEARVRTFLADSLALWRVDGTVEAAAAPIVAVIHAEGGTVIRIERTERRPVRPERSNAESKDEPPAEMPFRWIVHSRGVEDMRGGRTRPCGSLVGVLNAVRRALGVDRGAAVRIAPAPADTRSSFDFAPLRSGRTAESFGHTE